MSDKKKHEEPLLPKEDTAQPAPAEPVAAEPVAEPAPVEKTPEELLAAKNAELSDKLLRTMAEYDNFRKRSQRERESIYPQATANAVTQFVPILDTFERALATPCADEEFKKGVDMIHGQFKEILAKQGVEEFGASGDAFDPAIHNAVMHIDDETLETNVVVEVFQRGYRMGERIIRHAMVKVAN